MPKVTFEYHSCQNEHQEPQSLNSLARVVFGHFAITDAHRSIGR